MMNCKRTVLCTIIALTLFGCDDKNDTSATSGIDAAASAQTSVEAAKAPVKSPVIEAVIATETAIVEGEAAEAAAEAAVEPVAEAPAVAETKTTLADAPAATSAQAGEVAVTEVKEVAVVEAAAEVKAEPVEAPAAPAEAVEEKAEVVAETPAEVPAEVQAGAEKQASVNVPVVNPEEVLETLPEVVDAPKAVEPQVVEEKIAEAKSEEAPAETVTAVEPAATAEPVAQEEDKPVASAEGVEEAAVEPAPAVAVEPTPAKAEEPAAAPAVEAVAAAKAEEAKSELIEKVKAYVFDDIDPTLTVGTALKTRQVCESTEWVQRVDRRERDIAIYTCTHRGYEDYFDNLESERLAAYVENAKQQLPALQEKANKAEEAFNSYSWYLVFVDQLKDKKLIEGLVNIQKEEGNGNRYLSYLINADKAELLVGVNPELVDTYNGVFAVLDSLVGSTDVETTINMADVHIDERTKLYDDIVNNGFQKFIDDIAQGADIQATVNETDAKAKLLVDALEEANGQVETLEFQITNEGMENRLDAWNNDKPINVVSKISFAMGKDRPYVVGCKLSFFTPDNPEVPAFIKTIDDAKTCLVENYREEYDAFYHNAFAQFYQSRVK